MKHRLLLLLTCLLPCLQLHATGQEADIIYYEGHQYDLLARPILQNDKLVKQIYAYAGNDLSYTTANWEGIMGYWSIDGGQLVLDSVGYCSKGDRYALLDRKSFRKIFKPYRLRHRVVASWVSGEIRLGAGKVILYEHNAFVRNYEGEMIIDVKEGNIVSYKTFRNRVFPGLTLEDVVQKDSIEKHIPMDDIPELQGKRVVVKVSLTANQYVQGIDSCKVTIINQKPDTLSVSAQQRLKTVVANSLIATYPLKQHSIYGRKIIAMNPYFFTLDGRRPTRGPIFTQCDTMPEFPGGQKAMYDFIYSHVQWPAIARDWKGNWRVIMQFVVEKDGSLTCPQFLRRAGVPFEVEVLKMWRQLPRFKPAVKDGQPVRFWFILPVKFSDNA